MLSHQKQNKKLLVNIQVLNNAIKNFRMPTGFVCVPGHYTVKALISSKAQRAGPYSAGLCY